MHGEHHSGAATVRFVVVATTAFLTLVDLFAAQAILPFLTAAYGVTPAAMSFAVNASTIGMAAGGLGVALFSARINRRIGILAALGLLAIPTLLLSFLPPLPIFTLLRIAQGLCMSSAFALTLAYLGEHEEPSHAAVAFAAYVTGNVASNLVGRMISAGVADHFGLSANFLVFAVLNLSGAILVWFTVQACPRMRSHSEHGVSGFSVWLAHLRDPRLAAGFGIGFCLLFAFIGTFTFVNFILTREPLGLGMMQIGFVYLVFLPSILTTPLAGALVGRIGTRRAMWGALVVALVGLPLLIASRLNGVLAGMVLVAVGTFFAQAIATGFVSRTAETDRASASGIYLASYFSGGLAGSVVLGQIFDRSGWPACVAGIGVALLIASALTPFLVAARRPSFLTAT
jgi:predicted MFS family arabinose efflux permease